MSRSVSAPDTGAGNRTELELIRLATLLRGTRREFESVVRGTSIGNTIPSGALVRIVCQPHDHISVGSVISFVAGQTLITHRLVGRGTHGGARAYVVTHGDGAWLCDPPCDVDRVIGVAQLWQQRGDDHWHQVGTEQSRPGVSGAASRLVRRAICMALEIHVWLARGVFASLYLPRRLLGFPVGGPS